MPINRPFLDKLLLSFIDANLPSGDRWQSRLRSRERSLSAAKKALLGDKTRNAEINDRGALFYMAEAWHRDRMIDPRIRERITSKKPRSVRKLAKEACSFTIGNSSDSTAERLRSKFKKEKEKYLDLVRFSDDVDASLERCSLEKVRDLIGAHGVKLELDGDLRAARPSAKRKANFVRMIPREEPSTIQPIRQTVPRARGAGRTARRMSRVK